VQLKWVAPTDLLSSSAPKSAAAAASRAATATKNGAGASNLFAHLGGDIGASTAWRLGLSYLSTTAQNRSYDDLDSTGMQVNNSFDGTSRLWVLDGVLKWAPNGNSLPEISSCRRIFPAPGEWQSRLRYGPRFRAARKAAVTMRRMSGWYAQGVYPVHAALCARVTATTGSISGNVKLVWWTAARSLPADFPIYAAHNATRNTLMFDFSPSEFSACGSNSRATSRGWVSPTSGVPAVHHEPGAHGAHKF